MGRVVKGARVVPAERVRALMEADEILADARSEADDLLRAVAREARDICDKARNDGLREGQEEAEAILVAAAHKREKLLGDIQSDVATLAMEVARKVIRRELELHPETVVQLCSDVIRQVVLAQSIILKVHPDDVEMIRGHEALLSMGLDKSTSLRLVQDSSIERGGCVVESDMGKIDARIETQLAAIERALLADDG